MVNLKLKYIYNDRESEIGLWLKLFFGLFFFFPAEQVEDIFVDILMPEAVPDSEIQAFADYMFEAYIRPDARFLPPVVGRSTDRWKVLFLNQRPSLRQA